jgi:hypothetical protein
MTMASETTKEPILDRLKPHVDRLQSLLADQRTGTFSWTKAALTEWKAIRALWDEPDPIASPAPDSRVMRDEALDR